MNNSSSTCSSQLQLEEDDDDLSNDIPLADDDPQAVIQEDGADTFSQISGPNDKSYNMMSFTRSFDSLPSHSFTTSFTNDSLSSAGLDPDVSPDEQEEKEEKASLISQILELQNTLDDLSQRVDCVKEENYKLRSENQVLGQYIENLMAASSVCQRVK